MNLNCKLIYQEFDKILSVLGIVFSIFLLSNFLWSMKIDYLILGILLLISCLTWLYIRKNVSLEFHMPNSKNINLLLVSIFTILFIFCILSLHFRLILYQRPLIFFVFIAIMVGITSIESIFIRSNFIFVVLFQIILIGVSISWSQLLLFPSLVGVDPWYHQYFTLSILDSHFIPNGSNYSKLPLFHLFISLTSSITGLNYKFATMVSVSLLQIVCNVLFIFLFGRFLFSNEKIGILASLLVIVANHHVFMSYWSIPNSFGAIYFIPLFYSALKIKNSMPIRSVLLSILFMVSIVLTHSVTAMCMAIVLFVFLLGFYYCNFFYSKKVAPISLTYIILFIVFMFSWWSFASGHILTLSKILKFGFSPDFFVHTPANLALKGISQMTVLEQVFDSIAMFLFFTLAFIGVFYMVSKKYGNHLTFCMALVGITPLLLGFVSILTQRSIIEHRWWYFSQIFLCIPLSVSILAICNQFKKQSLKSVSIAVISILTSFILIISPQANFDHNLISDSMVYSLTSSELQTIETVSTFWAGTIKTDRYYSASQSYTYNTDNFDYELYENDMGSLEGEYTLIRKEIIGKPFKVFSSDVSIDLDLIFELNSLGYSEVYDCGRVYGFLKL